MNSKRTIAIVTVFLVFGGTTLLTAQDQAGRPISETCAELPFDSFPPNQWLRVLKPDGSAVSTLKSGKTGTWGQFFIQVDQPGTHRVDVDLLTGPSRGIFQLLVDGAVIGDPIDCYAPGAEPQRVVQAGAATFLKPGNHSFRFLVTGKNGASSGTEIALQRIILTPVTGFTLLSPNGSCHSDGNVVLRWNPWPQASKYQVELDGSMVNTVDTSVTTWQTSDLAPGPHRWRVIATGTDGKLWPSNFFSFVVGPPPPYPCREFSDDFSSPHPDDWALQSMRFSQDRGNHILEATAPGSAVHKTVRLDKTEGELSVKITPGGADSVAGVGFQADDGTQLYAVVDLIRNQLRLERKLQGSQRYSIFEVTPKDYQVDGWNERTEGEAIIWEIASLPIALEAGTACELKFAYSRRSGCVMATLLPSDGTKTVTLRDLTDLRTPDQPVLLCLSGRASFGTVSLRLLNKPVYKWDPDSIRIVLRPGEPGSWDSKGAFNPAVVVRDGTWHMVYRGNPKPAPPNGPIASEIGLATSTDGIHWTKSSANPIIRRDASGGSVEDPDLLWPKGSNEVYMEYNYRGEKMSSSSDFIHWSVPWLLNTGKTPGKMGGFIDTQNEPAIPEIQSGGTTYRYITMIEEGGIDVSTDLHQWIKAGTANLRGNPNVWCSDHECSGDIFVDHDRNIRYESQIGVKPASGHGGGVVGNRLCTIGEGVLSGSDPTKVLWKSDLPWLTDWYGNAPTGAPEDYTATNGSVFPGQTIVKDGWLWHLSGGNNHCTILCKCWYGPLLECRNLQTLVDASGQCSVNVTVRNIGSLPGAVNLSLLVDGKSVARERPSLERDAETTLHWNVPVPIGIHTLSVADLSSTVKH